MVRKSLLASSSIYDTDFYCVSWCILLTTFGLNLLSAVTAVPPRLLCPSILLDRRRDRYQIGAEGSRRTQEKWEHPLTSCGSVHSGMILHDSSQISFSHTGFCSPPLLPHPRGVGISSALCAPVLWYFPRSEQGDGGVHKCMHMLRASKSGWHSAGRLWCGSLPIPPFTRYKIAF
jgi:hypothetical protein